MALSVFAHVEPDAGALIPEQFFRQRFGRLSFSGTGRAGKEQHTLRFPGGGGVQSVHAGHRTLDHVQRALQRGILPLDPLFKVRLGGLQALHAQGTPGVFLDPVFVQVHNGTEVADRRFLFPAQHPHFVQFREGHPLSQADKPLLDPFQVLRVFRVVRHIPAVHSAGEEGREVRPGHHALPFLAVRRFQLQDLAHRVVQVEPCRQVVQLIHQQDQQVLLLPVGGADPGSAQRALHQDIETVHVRLVHPFRGRDVVAGHLHDGHRSRLLLGHGPADHVRRGVGAVSLELSLDRAGFDLRVRQVGKTLQHGGIIGAHKAQQVAVKQHLVVSLVGKIGMQVAAQRNNLVLPDGSVHRIPVLVGDVPFQDQQGFDRAEQFQLPVPFRNQCFHAWSSPFICCSCPDTPSAPPANRPYSVFRLSPYRKEDTASPAGHSRFHRRRQPT